MKHDYNIYYLINFFEIQCFLNECCTLYGVTYFPSGVTSPVLLSRNSLGMRYLLNDRKLKWKAKNLKHVLWKSNAKPFNQIIQWHCLQMSFALCKIHIVFPGLFVSTIYNKILIQEFMGKKGHLQSTQSCWHWWFVAY